MEFILAMVICNSILFLTFYILFLLDTVEVRRLHKISKKDNKRRK
ncbi:unknown [Lactococcus phage SK1]|uniref:Uncharacterized protein n=3 Tax=Skunavirus TaxID=1623305 RepID=O21917_BPLSK|nr:hypothetical protein sk1p51 [Lactococcus phage SK1]YP_764308.1 hypothetical protein LPV712_gp048 [Lactococcus phage 712]AAB70088.1 unknown [Lactococcus phage SK1]ABB77615.1 hypothetical protein [Lactococcus phage 712]AHC30304.1 hypothetical protein sk1833_049 [Lactococcus phage SK1833]